MEKDDGAGDGGGGEENREGGNEEREILASTSKGSRINCMEESWMGHTELLNGDEEGRVEETAKSGDNEDEDMEIEVDAADVEG